MGFGPVGPAGFTGWLDPESVGALVFIIIPPHYHFQHISLSLILNSQMSAASLAPAGFPPARIPSFNGGRRRPMAVVAAAPAAAAAGTAASPYEVLRVETTATVREIKAAYRALAKRFHPDIIGDGEMDFVEIQKAYSTLSDPALRARYDRSIRAGIGIAGGSRLGGRRWETDQCW